MRTLAEAHQAHLAAVQHARAPRPLPSPSPAALDASCARCGGPLRSAANGAARPGARFCSTACRQGAVRERRAAARADLLQALALLQDATARVERALSALGLNPKRPRSRARR